MSGPFEPGERVVRVPIGRETCDWLHPNQGCPSIPPGTVCQVTAYVPESENDCAGVFLAGYRNPNGFCAGSFRRLRPAELEARTAWAEMLREAESPARKKERV